jgi:HEAT repeat protein
LLGDPDPQVRALVVQHLAYRGEWAGEVLDALLTDADDRARTAGLTVFAGTYHQMPEARRSPAREAVRAALTAPDPAVRSAAVTALGAVEDAESRELLATVSTGDPHSGVRLRATRRLARTSDTSAIIPTLVALLDDEDPAIRYEALIRLRSDPPGTAWVPAVRSRLADPDPSVCREALFVLTRAGVALADDEWVALLTDPDGEPRSLASRVVEDVRPAPGGRVHDALHDRLRDPLVKVRGTRHAACGRCAITCPHL